MATINLTRGFVALIDDEDAARLRAFNWRAMKMHGQDRYCYAVTGAKKVTPMHRMIMSAPKGLCVDHINGNSLDNRKINLRVCSHAQNMKNRRATNRFKGPRFDKSSKSPNPWKAFIVSDGNEYCLGRFPSEEAAALAYDAAAIRLHGEFARLNFPG